MTTPATVRILKRKRMVSTDVRQGQVRYYKEYESWIEAAIEAETLGLIERLLAATLPKYGLGFHCEVYHILPKTLLDAGFSYDALGRSYRA